VASEGVASGNFRFRSAPFRSYMRSANASSAHHSPRPRHEPRHGDALLEDPERAARQALDIAVRHRINLHDGSELCLVAKTLCIHSDTPGAATIARAVSERLNKAAGVQIRAMSPVGG
jgi:hypothetical protein